MGEEGLERVDGDSNLALDLDRGSQIREKLRRSKFHLSISDERLSLK